MAEYIFGTKNLEYLQKKYGFSPRQLGKQVVLGAGYGIGMNGEKFRDTCKKYGIEISLDLAQRAVRAYRDLHRPIPAFWENIEKAATLALENPGKGLRIGHLRWCYEKPYLTVRLPIGRKLHYYKPTLELKEAGFGSQSLYGPKPTLFFWGTNSKTKKLEKISTWGGKLTENVVQAVSRDLLYEALQRLESSTSKPVLAVHDEIVCERKQGVGDLKSFLNTMSLAPEWAKGLPIKVEGWSEKRYRK
jgi:DNA polymerase